MNYEKILKLLQDYQNDPSAQDDQSAFLQGICHMQLGNLKEARYLFEKACVAMFISPMFWERSNQPNWLVNICVLSGRNDLYKNVIKELDLFKSRSRGEGLNLVYSYGLMELILPSKGDLQERIERLLKKPKIKDMYAIGLILQAIFHNDQSSFNVSLKKLLEAHEGQAKHGDLRWSAEGLICMPAMSLALVAMKNKLKIELENEYLPIGYLVHLMDG